MLITICPSRERPELAQRMYYSWLDTKTREAHLVLYVADDDPTEPKYKELFKDAKYMTLHTGKRLTVIEVFNKMVEAYPNNEYYNFVNDDHIFRTDGWDDKLIKAIEVKGGGWGIACGNDLMHDDWYKYQHPSAEIVSGNIIRTLGYAYYPRLKHLGADIYIKALSLGLNRLFYVPEVIIEHMHGGVAKGGYDENYKKVYAPESYNYCIDTLNYMYANGVVNGNIEKIEKAMRDERMTKQVIPDPKNREGVLENMVRDLTVKIMEKSGVNVKVKRMTEDYIPPDDFIDKIAVLMPTRFRPKIFQRMIDSWAKTSERSDLIVGLQVDDPDKELYKNIINKCRAKNIFITELEDIGLVNKYNELYKRFPDYDAYALLNDDHVFRTMFWDRKIYKLIDDIERKEGHRLVIPCWKDGWLNEDMPAGFATKELLHIIKTPCPVGYMSHVYLDNTYAAMSGLGGIREYMPEIFIEHMHVTKGKAKADKNYMNHKYSNDYDYCGYVKWLNEKCEDIATEILETKNDAINRTNREANFGYSAEHYRPSV